MHREKKFIRNGFHSHEEMIVMFRWLRELGMTQESIASLYGVTKMYVSKKTRDIQPAKIINRKPKPASK